MRRINTLETTIMEQKDQLDLARQVCTALLRAQIRVAASPQDYCRREHQSMITPCLGCVKSLIVSMTAGQRRVAQSQGPRTCPQRRPGPPFARFRSCSSLPMDWQGVQQLPRLMRFLRCLRSETALLPRVPLRTASCACSEACSEAVAVQWHCVRAKMTCVPQR